MTAGFFIFHLLTQHLVFYNLKFIDQTINLEHKHSSAVLYCCGSQEKSKNCTVKFQNAVKSKCLGICYLIKRGMFIANAEIH